MAAFSAKQGGAPAAAPTPAERRGEGHDSKADAPKGEIKFGTADKGIASKNRGFGA